MKHLFKGTVIGIHALLSEKGDRKTEDFSPALIVQLVIVGADYYQSL